MFYEYNPVAFLGLLEGIAEFEVFFCTRLHHTLKVLTSINRSEAQEGTVLKPM